MGVATNIGQTRCVTASEILYFGGVTILRGIDLKPDPVAVFPALVTICAVRKAGNVDRQRPLKTTAVGPRHSADLGGIEQRC